MLTDANRRLRAEKCNPPFGDRLIQSHHPIAELHPLRRAQVGAGHRHQEGGGGTDDVKVAGERVVFFIRAAAELN